MRTVGFNEAVEAAKLGKFVRRATWETRSYLFYIHGGHVAAWQLEHDMHSADNKPIMRRLAEEAERYNYLTFAPKFGTLGADKIVRIGWAPMVEDMIAQDWQIVE